MLFSDSNNRKNRIKVIKIKRESLGKGYCYLKWRDNVCIWLYPSIHPFRDSWRICGRRGHAGYRGASHVSRGTQSTLRGRCLPSQTRNVLTTYTYVLLTFLTLDNWQLPAVWTSKTLPLIEKNKCFLQFVLTDSQIFFIQLRKYEERGKRRHAVKGMISLCVYVLCVAVAQCRTVLITL